MTKSNGQPTNGREVLHSIHADCKRWRGIVSQLGRFGTVVPAFMEDEYKEVHQRILANCRRLATDESLPQNHRTTASQLDEVLRPWYSTSVLKNAPDGIVNDLVRNQRVLDGRLQGGASSGELGPWLRKLAIIGGVGLAVSALLFLLVQWVSNAPSGRLLHSLQDAVAEVAVYIERSSFTEQIVIAVFLAWLLGLWVLSRLSRN